MHLLLWLFSNMSYVQQFIFICISSMNFQTVSCEIIMNQVINIIYGRKFGGRLSLHYLT
ncbi:hypothetical protein HanRHA438_Chr13g0629611 [Helianthus annuus]|nr:hypothetical protein HanRHA438_Chr13g0629611 [Helianthus annuus]